MASTTTTDVEQAPSTTAAEQPTEGKRRRTRKYRKRTKFQHVPKMPYPVRSLWDAASEEEKQRAHQMCTALLELWLGKATKTEVLERLQIPALRLWQLSQQALAGMVAGLLKQPKRRPPQGELVMPNPENDLKVLRKKNVELQKENEELKLLLSLLRELPSNRERAAAMKIPRHLEPVPPIKWSEPAPPSSEPTAAAKSPPATKRPRGRPKMDRGTDPERPDQAPKP